MNELQKNNQNSEDNELIRDKLIVPEEIFAAEEEAATEQDDRSSSEDSALITDEASEPQEEYEQIAFFDEIKEEAEPEELTEQAPPVEDKEAKDEDVYDSESPRLVDKLFDFLELFVFTVAAVFIITTFFFRHAVVDGDSMSGTLENNEHLIISDIFYSPKTDDIIVFEDYTLPEHLRIPIVKRVIATEGDRVRIDFDGKVYVNGEPIPDEHAVFEGGRYIPMLSHVYATGEEYTVPEGTVFVLGDNRNNSTDSRAFGAIDEDAILGKVIVRLFPFEKFGTVD